METSGPTGFCAENNFTLTVLAEMNHTKLDNLLMDCVSAKEKQYPGSHIESTVKAVKSWLTHNGIELKRKIKIRGASETLSLKEESAWLGGKRCG